MYKIYHNPRCSKSRASVKYLEDNNLEYEIVEYLKNPPTEKEIKELLNLLNLTAFEIVRKGEEIFKKEYKKLTLTDEEWIKVLVQNPKLIERPIIVKGHKAVIGRPTENIDLLS